MGGGINSNGIHVAVEKGMGFGVAMHELVGHGHPAYGPGDENDLGNAFGSGTRNPWHDAGRDEGYGPGPGGSRYGGYQAGYNYQNALYKFLGVGSTTPKFLPPGPLPSRAAMYRIMDYQIRNHF